MEKLVIAGKEFNSRLFLGTGKFKSNDLMEKAILASGSEMVTVAMKRIDLDDKEDDMWQVEIYARLKADNGQYFTTEELLFKIHNLMANKELGDHVFFENLVYDDHEFEADEIEDIDDNDEGIPVFVVWLGS